MLVDRFQLEERRRRTQSAGDLGERRFYGRYDDNRLIHKTSFSKTDGKTENQEGNAKGGEYTDGDGKLQNDGKSSQNKKVNAKQIGNGKQQMSSPVRQPGRQQQYQRGQQSHLQQMQGQQQRQHVRQNRRVSRNDGKQPNENKQNGSKGNVQQKTKQGKPSDTQNGKSMFGS